MTLKTVETLGNPIAPVNTINPKVPKPSKLSTEQLAAERISKRGSLGCVEGFLGLGFRILGVA